MEAIPAKGQPARNVGVQIQVRQQSPDHGQQDASGFPIMRKPLLEFHQPRLGEPGLLIERRHFPANSDGINAG